MRTLINHNLKTIIGRIREAEQHYHRPSNSVTLLAISKSQPVELIVKLVEAGQTAFGENYLQEALQKIVALKDRSLEWHFVGAIQSRKASEIAKHFNWVHSVGRFIEAQKLSLSRPCTLPPLNICLQVKLDNNPKKSGVAPNELSALAKAVQGLPHLQLRGLMALPPPLDVFEEQRSYFSKLRELFAQLQNEGLPLDTLSMGMTHDFEAAIAEGSTLVRIGTGIFGSRGK